MRAGSWATLVLRVVGGVLLFSCGDYYDKAPPMTPNDARRAKTDGPKKVPFSLGAGVPADVEQGAQALKTACDDGDAGSCNQLGQLSMSKTWNAKNAVRAVDFFGQACELGSAAGCENLAEAYESGDGTPIDMSKTWALHERACRGHRGFACMKLGTRYATGQGGIPRDLPRGREYLQHACEEGDSDACQLNSVIAACIAQSEPDACKPLDVLRDRLDGLQAVVDGGPTPKP